MSRKKRFITCEICGYRSRRSSQQEKRMFMAKFPLNEARCKKWVKVVGKEDLAYVPIEKLHSLKYVCGNHFRSGDFNKHRNRLKKSAVPSINLKADALPDEMLNEFPCHIHSEYSDIDGAIMDYVTQGISDKDPSVVQFVKAQNNICVIGAGPTKSGCGLRCCMLAQEMPVHSGLEDTKVVVIWIHIGRQHIPFLTGSHKKRICEAFSAYIQLPTTTSTTVNIPSTRYFVNISRQTLPVAVINIEQK